MNFHIFPSYKNTNFPHSGKIHARKIEQTAIQFHTCIVSNGVLQAIQLDLYLTVSKLEGKKSIH